MVDIVAFARSASRSWLREAVNLHAASIGSAAVVHWIGLS
jgi:hypothetical protein